MSTVWRDRTAGTLDAQALKASARRFLGGARLVKPGDDTRAAGMLALHSKQVRFVLRLGDRHEAFAANGIDRTVRVVAMRKPRHISHCCSSFEMAIEWMDSYRPMTGKIAIGEK